MNIGRIEIDVLRRAGMLPAARYAPALALARDRPGWARWARHALLALGLGHLLAGIVFFFAYNWADIADLAKFAVVEAGIVLAVAGALWRGAGRPEGAAALIAATVLTGVLLAVIGQVYQSGADPWQLFALWAGLSLPWALASKNAGHWLVWLVVLHIAAILFSEQALVRQGIVGEMAALLGVALLPVIVLVAREALVASGASWADRRWTRLLPALAASIGLGMGAAQFLLEQERAAVPNTVAFLALLGAMAFVYRRALPDLAMLALATGFAGLFLIGVGVRMLFGTLVSGFDDGGMPVLLLGLLVAWVVAVVAGAARLLRHLRQTMPESATGGGA